MITPESRYQDSAKTFATAHVYDQYGRLYLNGDDPVPAPRTVTHETLYRLTTPSIPEVSPLEYLVKEGESMNFCAWKLLGAHSNWWRLADANPNIWYPLDVVPGTKLKVPA
jgi:hypothetical protein